jgi:hypothetical protein
MEASGEIRLKQGEASKEAVKATAATQCSSCLVRFESRFPDRHDMGIKFLTKAKDGDFCVGGLFFAVCGKGTTAQTEH